MPEQARVAPDLGHDEPPPGTTRRVFRPRLWVSLVAAAMLACLIALGNWQAGRFREAKEGIAAFAAQHDQPPLRQLGAVPGGGEDLARLRALHFRRAELQGVLEPAQAQLLTARYMFGRRGYGVMMPLRLDGDGPSRGPYERLLVHLGWVPDDKVASYLAEVAAAPRRTILGRLQVPPLEPAQRTVGEHAGRPTWPRAWPMGLRDSIPGIDPRLMLQAGALAVGDIVDPQRVPLDGYAHPVRIPPSKHAEYAATWYGLAVALVGVWIALSLRRVPLAGATALLLCLVAALSSAGAGCSEAPAKPSGAAAALDVAPADTGAGDAAAATDAGDNGGRAGADAGDMAESPDAPDAGHDTDADAGTSADGAASPEPDFWLRTFGGAPRDALDGLLALPGGALVAIGHTESAGAGGRDVLLLRLDPCGAPLAAHTYGGTGRDEGRGVTALAGGDLLVVGTTESFGEGNEALVLRVQDDGTPLWSRAVGGSSWDTAAAVTATADDGAIVVGETYSFGPKAPTKHNLFVFRLTKEGALFYERTYGGPKDGDAGFAVLYEASDGGALIGGASESFGQGKDDAWLLRLDAGGELVWSRTYGSSADDEARALVRGPDGALLLAGFTRGFGAKLSDAFLLRVDPAGSLLGMTRYGSPGDDRALAVLPRTDGGFLLVGVTDHWDGAQDGHALALDAFAQPVWQRRIGGEQLDEAVAAVPGAADAFFWAGWTESYGNGGRDAFAGRVRADGEGGCKVRVPSSAWTSGQAAAVEAVATPSSDKGAKARPVELKAASFTLPAAGPAAISCLAATCPGGGP